MSLTEYQRINMLRNNTFRRTLIAAGGKVQYYCSCLPMSYITVLLLTYSESCSTTKPRTKFHTISFGKIPSLLSSRDTI